MNEKVWRGWARWNERLHHYGSTKFFAPTLTKNVPNDARLRSAYMKNCKAVEVVLLPAADYDVLKARVAECDELQASLNLYHDALMRGTKIWWEAHPDQADTLPDTASMMAWFVDALTDMTDIASQRLAHETRMRVERDTALAELATARAECERLRGECEAEQRARKRANMAVVLAQEIIAKHESELNTLRAQAARGKE